MTQNDMNPPYYVLAQSAYDLLVIGMKGENKCLRRTASEVLAEPRLLAGLSAKDRALIESIASMGNGPQQRRRNRRKKVKDCI